MNSGDNGGVAGSDAARDLSAIQLTIPQQDKWNLEDRRMIGDADDNTLSADHFSLARAVEKSIGRKQGSVF
jgi:hypothetical protein